MIYRCREINQRLAVAYLQCEALYITNTQCCISSSRRRMHLRWWYTPCGDDIHAKAWWYTKPAAWIKKDKSEDLSFLWWTITDSNRWPFARQANALPAELIVHSDSYYSNALPKCQGQISNFLKYFNKSRPHPKGCGRYGFYQVTRTMQESFTSPMVA